MTERQTNKTAAMSAEEKGRQMRCARAVCHLADLLTEAAPLVNILNSTGTPHIYRSKLRELVGPDAYFELASTLHQMCSRRRWEMAHSKTPVARIKSCEPHINAATVGERGVICRRNTKS